MLTPQMKIHMDNLAREHTASIACHRQQPDQCISMYFTDRFYPTAEVSLPHQMITHLHLSDDVDWTYAEDAHMLWKDMHILCELDVHRCNQCSTHCQQCDLPTCVECNPFENNRSVETLAEMFSTWGRTAIDMFSLVDERDYYTIHHLGTGTTHQDTTMHSVVGFTTWRIRADALKRVLSQFTPLEEWRKGEPAAYANYFQSHEDYALAVDYYLERLDALEDIYNWMTEEDGDAWRAGVLTSSRATDRTLSALKTLREERESVDRAIFIRESKRQRIAITAGGDGNTSAREKLDHYWSDEELDE